MDFSRADDRARAEVLQRDLVRHVLRHARAAEIARQAIRLRDARESYVRRQEKKEVAIAMWRAAGESLRPNLTPALYLRQLVWRVGAAEDEARTLTTNVPIPESVPAHMLMSLKIDIEPERAFELTRGCPTLTETLLEIEEARTRKR